MKKQLLLLLISIAIIAGCSKDKEVEEPYDLQSFHLNPREVIHRIDFDNVGTWKTEVFSDLEIPCDSVFTRDTAKVYIKDGILSLRPNLIDPNGKDQINAVSAYWDTTDVGVHMEGSGLKGGIGIEIGFEKYEIEESTNITFIQSADLLIQVEDYEASITKAGEFWDPRTENKIHLYIRPGIIYRPVLTNNQELLTLGCGIDEICENGYRIQGINGDNKNYLKIRFTNHIGFSFFSVQQCQAYNADIDYIEIYRLK